MTHPHSQGEYQRRPTKYWDNKARKPEDVAQCSNFRDVFQMLWQAKAGPRSKL